MHFSYPKFSQTDLRVDLLRVACPRGQSIGLQASSDRVCGRGGESAALGFPPQLMATRLAVNTAAFLRGAFIFADFAPK